MESSALGYILDFLAGFFIIQSIILRSYRHMKVETDTLWDGNPLLYEAQLKAFWDGWLGVSLLFIGLLLHLFHFELPFLLGSLATVIIVVVSFTILHLLNRHIAKKVRGVYSYYDEVKRRAQTK